MSARKMVLPVRLAAVASLSVVLCGCVNLVPVPKMGEKEEAKALGRIFRTEMATVREELNLEHHVAESLKITLEEFQHMEPKVFQDKFGGYIDQLVSIREKRRQVLNVIGEKLWQSPMVFAIQQHAIRDLESELVRTQSWIQLAEDIKLRSDLRNSALLTKMKPEDPNKLRTDEPGKAKPEEQKQFPEFDTLRNELNTFLGETNEDPLGNQLRALQNEFRFGDAEIGWNRRKPALVLNA